jgi:iron complex transport system substrate-binding protein
MIRTVSMLPAATEIVGALGLMDQLVGVYHECDFPAEANLKPRVTHCEIYGRGLPSAEIDQWVSSRIRSGDSLYTIDEELLRRLEPDLILTQQLCDVCAPAYGSVAALAKALPSKPEVLNLEPRLLHEVIEDFEIVAKAMGHPGRGLEALRPLDERIRRVHQRVEGLSKPTAFIMEWVEPIYNSGHWNPQLIRYAGGKAVLSVEKAQAVQISWEDLRAADPEVLVIACCGHSVERTLQDIPLLKKLPGWNGLHAVRNGRAFIADGCAYFSRPGPRIVDTFEILAKLLHPKECGDLYQGDKVVAI